MFMYRFRLSGSQTSETIHHCTGVPSRLFTGAGLDTFQTLLLWHDPLLTPSTLPQKPCKVPDRDITDSPAELFVQSQGWQLSFIHILLPQIPFPVFIYWTYESVNAKIDVWDSWSHYCFSSFTSVLPMLCFLYWFTSERRMPLLVKKSQEVDQEIGNKFQGYIQVNSYFPSNLMQTPCLLCSIVTAPKTE